jgi:hypothetical protein
VGLDLSRRKRPPVMALDILDLGDAHLLLLHTRLRADPGEVQEFAEGLMAALSPLLSGLESMGYLSIPQEIAVTYRRSGDGHD